MHSLPDLLRNRLRAQADLFAALTDHPTIVGSGREHALTEVLREFLPRRFELLNGAIARVDEAKEPQIGNAQVDIMLVDTIDYPLLLRVGAMVVALPQAVAAAIEVKSDLRKGKRFWDAVEQISRVQMGAGAENRFVTALFSFSAPADAKRLRAWLEGLLQERKRRGKKADRAKNPGQKRKLRATEAALAAVFLPDLIFSDRGAVAIKSEVAARGGKVPAYKFYTTEQGALAAVAFVEHIVRRTAPRVADTVPAATRGSVQLSEAFELVSVFLRSPLSEAKGCAPLAVG